MAWVLTTGEDVEFYRDSLKMLRPEGYDVLAAPDGATALQLLVEIGHGMVVLLRPQMGRMDAGAFLSAAAANDAVRRRHAFILLDGKPGSLPADVERHRAELAVPVVETPADASDADNWADLLEAVALAVRQLS